MSENKRLLFTTSARDSFISESLDAWYEVQPWLPASLLYNLRDRGWEIRILDFRGSVNPVNVARVMKEFNPSLTVTFFATALSAVIARKLFCRWRGPVVFMWNDYYDEVYRGAFGVVPGLLMKVYEKTLVKTADYVTTISNYNRMRAERWGRKATVIPLTCDKPEYDPTACGIELDGDFKLVHLGDADRYRRSHLLLEAMRDVPEGVKLYFIGGARQDLKERAPGNCVFLGRLSQNDKWSVMAQADAFVSSTDQDCAGKYYEYMVMEKPVIAASGKAELLFKDGRNALLTDDFAAAIRRLMDSPELRRELSANALRDIEINSWSESILQYEAAYAEALEDYATGSGRP